MTHLFVTVGISVFSNMLRWAAEIKHPDLEGLQSAWRKLLKEKVVTKEAKLLVDVVKDEFFKYTEQDDVYQHGGVVLPKMGTRTAIRNSQHLNFEKNYDASAETQSIHQILSAAQWQKEQLLVHLISTDTKLSRMAAQVLEYYFEDEPRIDTIDHKVIAGLQINNQNEFQDSGFQELIGHIEKLKTTSVLIDGEHLQLPAIINVTGGYKGVVPILTIAGQLLDMPIVYLYEGNNNLIVIPALPLSFDWTCMEVYRYYFSKLETQTLDSKIGRKKQRERIYRATHFDSDEDFEDFKELFLENALMRKLPDSEDFAITFLGRLMQQHIEAVYPAATNTFGLAIEFLFYEYLINEPLKWQGTTYYWVQHNVKVGKYDIDLILYPNRQNKDSAIIAEVTSYGQLQVRNSNNYFHFKKQFKRQIKALRESNTTPACYLLFLYGYQVVNDWESLQPALVYIWSVLQENGFEAFQIFTVDLPIRLNKNTNNRNPYSAIYQKKLSRDKQLIKQHFDPKYGNTYLPVLMMHSFQRQ